MLGNVRNHYPYSITIRARKAEGELTRDENNAVNWNDNANYSTLYSGWARVASQTGREFELARQQHSSLAYVIIVPSCTETRGITGAHRITFDGRDVDVLASYDRGANRDEVVILAAERRS